MLRLRYSGGEKVKRGDYWNFSTDECVTIEKIGGALPGDSSATYYKAYPLMVLLAGPVLGLVYAIFLPFIGMAVLLKVVMAKLLAGMVKLLAGVMEGFSNLAVFNWRPSEAYFAGRRHKKATEDKGNKSEKKADKDTEEI